MFMVWIAFLPGCLLFSQSHTSRDKYSGAWETPASWNPTWPLPQTNISGYDITIYGYITRNGSLSFTGGSADLIVHDTLVIKGDLTIGHKDNLTIKDNSILIIRGNFAFDNEATITVNGYLIITGNVDRIGSGAKRPFTSNDNPVKVFVGGDIDTEIKNSSNYPIFKCSSPPTTPFPNSGCPYGNMIDFANDPLYPFFQTTCTISTPTISAGGPTTFCAGDSVTLISSAGTTYSWSTGATTSTINVSSSGSNTVRVTNASGCQSAASVAIILTVNALPASPTITAGGPTTFCAGGSVTLTSSAGTSYLWSNGATTASINVTTSGSYTVRVTNANGCQSAASSGIIVTVNALPATPTITAGGPTTFCAGGSVALTSSAGSTYLWSSGATTASIIVSQSVSYNVRITNASGCQSASSSATVVSVNTLPVVNAGIDATFPNGTSTTLNATVSGTGPFTYSWTPASQLVNAFIEDPTTENLSATTIFTLTATSATTSCSNTETVTISVSGGPLASAPTAGTGTICAGKTIQLNALAGGGSGSYTYTWTSVPAGFTSSIADPTDNPTVNTTYWVSVFDGFTTVNSQVSVTVNALPSTPTITSGGPTNFCVGDNVTLTSSTATTYLWSTGAITQSINVTAEGSYTVQVTNASGCPSPLSIATILTVNALPATPTITPGGTTTFCAGGNVNLSSSAGTSFLWSNAVTTSSINISLAGNYTVQVTDANGCQSASSSPIVVTVNTLPATPTITAGGPTTFCAGGSVMLTSSAGTSYLWSNGATSSIIYITTSGSYTVRVINVNGCQSTVTAMTEVTVNGSPEATAGNNGPVFSLKPLNLTGVPEAMTTYLWTGPGGFTSNSQSPSVSASALAAMAGEYTFTVTDARGCSNSATTTVEVIELLIPSVITPNGDGKNDCFVIGEIIDQVELTIINRWGNIEYTNGNYLNDWDGRNNKGAELPNETYFYILKFENGNILKGSVLIKR